MVLFAVLLSDEPHSFALLRCLVSQEGITKAVAFLHKKGLISKSASAASVGKSKKPAGPTALVLIQSEHHVFSRFAGADTYRSADRREVGRAHPRCRGARGICCSRGAAASARGQCHKVGERSDRIVINSECCSTVHSINATPSLPTLLLRRDGVDLALVGGWMPAHSLIAAAFLRRLPHPRRQRQRLLMLEQKPRKQPQRPAQPSRWRPTCRVRRS